MRTFWIVAIGLLLWNIMGDIAYLMQVSANLDTVARTDPVQADAFRAMPAWAWSAYAIAVWGGTAGAIALLARRRIATVLFAIALAGVIVQFGWSFLGFGLIAKKGVATVAFPLVIFAIGVFSTVYARGKTTDGTLR